MYIKRNCESMLLELAKSFPCIVVYGPRQVGKSTTVDRLFGQRYKVVTLDDLEDRNLAVQNPRLFLEHYGWPLVIDEIQKTPLLLDEIKKIIDRQRLLWLKNNQPRELMYILTGSNRFELQQGVSESLAGRCGVVEMDSLSRAEIMGTAGAPFDPDPDSLKKLQQEHSDAYRSRQSVFESIFSGGMPDIVTGVSQRDSYFRSYISTYLEKDVRRLIAAGSELAFRNFLSLIALRTAQELHYDTLAASVGIDTRTCKKWISILETSGLVYLLQPFLANISNRIIKTPKLYFMDTGLCAALCKWPNSQMLADCAMSGAFFETYVVSELVKNYHAHNRDPKEELFYYRDIDQKEVDLLIVRQNTIVPIEIKSGAFAKNPTRNFKTLAKYKLPVQPGLVIDTGEKIYPITESTFSLPVSLLGL